MSESEASIQDSCRRVCQELAEQEKAWLDRFYSGDSEQDFERIKETETVSLPQHSIALPLLAQEHVLRLFNELGIDYVYTKWRKISEKLPKVNYEYMNWSIPVEEEPDIVSLYEFDRGVKYEIGKQIHLKMHGKNSLMGVRRSAVAHKESRQNEVFRQRTRTVKQRNKQLVDDWCSELEKLMADALN